MPCVLSSFCVVDLTQRLSNHTQVSANFISQAGWTNLARNWILIALVASNTLRGCYFFFQFCIWMLIFSVVWQVQKKYHSALLGSRALGFTSGEVGNNHLAMCLLCRLFTLWPFPESKLNSNCCTQTNILKFIHLALVWFDHYLYFRSNKLSLMRS